MANKRQEHHARYKWEQLQRQGRAHLVPSDTPWDMLPSALSAPGDVIRGDENNDEPLSVRSSVCQVSFTFIHRLRSGMSEALLSWSPLLPRSKPRILSRHLPSFVIDVTSQPQNTPLLALRNLPAAASNMLLPESLFFSPYSFWSSYPTRMYNISFWREKNRLHPKELTTVCFLTLHATPDKWVTQAFHVPSGGLAAKASLVIPPAWRLGPWWIVSKASLRLFFNI